MQTSVDTVSSDTIHITTSLTLLLLAVDKVQICPIKDAHDAQGMDPPEAGLFTKRHQAPP